MDQMNLPMTPLQVRCKSTRAFSGWKMITKRNSPHGHPLFDKSGDNTLYTSSSPQFTIKNVDFLERFIVFVFVAAFISSFFYTSWKGIIITTVSLIGGARYISSVVWENSILFPKNVKQLIFSIPIIGTFGLFYASENITTTIAPLWVMGLVTGLHFGFLDSLPLFRNFDITPSKMKLWKWPQWTLFYSIIAVLFSIVFYAIPKVPILVAMVYAIIPFIIAAITWFVYPLYVFHFHHYFIAAYFIPLVSSCQPDAFLLLVSGCLSGVYVQGVVVWGLAWIWQRNK